MSKVLKVTAIDCG